MLRLAAILAGGGALALGLIGEPPPGAEARAEKAVPARHTG
ncbi:MAG: hypothetical protein ACKODX_13430 [Gemmata sp.]|jgi:hypothetical protein